MNLPLRGALAPLTLPGNLSSTLRNGLVRYYKLDEASGSRVDSVAGLNLADNNTVTQASGKVGNAGQFTAANLEFLSGSDSGLVFAAVDFSVSVWVYVDTLTGGNASDGRGVVSVHNSDAIGDWHIGVIPGLRRVSFSHWKSAGADTTGNHRTSTGPITDATFHHIVCRKSGSAYSIWVNGSSQAMLSDSTTSSGWTTTDFNMGRIFTGSAQYNWDGRIDELGLWSRAITDAEVSALYNGGSGITYPF